MLDDAHFLKWYNSVQEDKIRRSLGLLRPDQGILTPEDKLQLRIDRGEFPNEEPQDEESIRRRMGLQRRQSR